ncbi:MAG: hypothetical protein ACFCUN_09850 [Hyphomicrobiaceae bacterium]
MNRKRGGSRGRGAGRRGHASQEAVSHMFRAAWAALFVLLVGPFFAALATLVLFGLALGFGIAPGDFAGKSLADAGGHVAPVAVMAFVWSIIPAILAATAVFLVVSRNGSVGMLTTAASGVVAFALGVLITPIPVGGWLPLLSFVAGLVALGCREVLIARRILAR